MKKWIWPNIAFAIQVGILTLAFSALIAGESWAEAVDPSVASYINQLRDPNPKVRYEALDALERMGPQAQPAVPYLIEILKDPSASNRIWAALALGSIARERNSKDMAIPALIAALDDPDANVRANVSVALGDFGPSAKAAIPKLLEVALKDSTERGREFAPEALGKIDSDLQYVIPELFKALQHPNSIVRANAARTLGEFPSGYISGLLERSPTGSIERWEAPPEIKAIKPKLIAALKDREARVRSSAADALSSFVSTTDISDVQSAIPDLISLLKDPDASVRASAASTLRIFDYQEGKPTAKLAESELFVALRDPDAKVRARAASTLGDIGTDEKRIVPELIKLLKDTDSQVQAVAARALGNFASKHEGKEIKAASSELIALLDNSDETVRASAISAIGIIGADPEIVVPKLIRLLKDQKSQTVRWNAALALGNLRAKPEVLVPELISVVKSNDFLAQQMAIMALGEFGSDAKSAVPTLVEILKTPEYPFRSDAAATLGSIGAEAKAAIPSLISVLKDPNELLRSAAAEALGDIGIEAKQAFPALIATLDESSELVQHSATEALLKIFLADKVDSTGKPSVAKLTAALSDPNPFVRSFAAASLGVFGKESQKSISALIKMLHDADSRVQTAVVFALGKITDASPTALEEVSTPDLEEAIGSLDQLIKETEKQNCYEGQQLIQMQQLQNQLKAARNSRLQK